MMAEEHVDFSFETLTEDRSLINFLLMTRNGMLIFYIFSLEI